MWVRVGGSQRARPLVRASPGGAWRQTALCRLPTGACGGVSFFREEKTGQRKEASTPRHTSSDIALSWIDSNCFNCFGLGGAFCSGDPRTARAFKFPVAGHQRSAHICIASTSHCSARRSSRLSLHTRLSSHPIFAPARPMHCLGGAVTKFGTPNAFGGPSPVQSPRPKALGSRAAAASCAMI